MDRIEAAIDAVDAINKFSTKEITSSEMISKVCSCFDIYKNEALSEADKNFLVFLSSKVGIPHYYDMLKNFEKINNIFIEDVNLGTFSSILYESTLYTDKFFKLHKYQKEVLDKFSIGSINRYFLSASTSFGKTFLVYEVIKKMKYQNIILIFPTIALLSENLERLREDDKYNYFDDYSIHTLSETDEGEITEKNIFIFTPERFLSFVDRNSQKIDFDFIFVDEVYKIDNEYLIDEELKESERDLAYRLAIFYALKEYSNIDVLLVGPYINFYNKDSKNYNPSFDLFLKDFNIELVNKNEYEIVNKDIVSFGDKIATSDNLSFDFKNCGTKSKKLKVVVKEIISKNENLIIYCADRASAESNSLDIVNSEIMGNYDYSNFSTFIKHLEDKYDKDWAIIQSLKKGIGIHHGLVPKYIQKEMINLFNSGKIKLLFVTTTITEGVNTSAKNLLVYFHKKGKKDLQPFDAKNIAGRAGRFLHHYSGRVMSLEKEFINILESSGDGIKHKNYDKDSNKSEIDVEITKSEYLTTDEIDRNNKIKLLQEEKGIPNEIIWQFKVVSREDKIYIYDQIASLSAEKMQCIQKLIQKINYNLRVDFDGLQVILDILIPKVKLSRLKYYIEKKYPNNIVQPANSKLFPEYSILCVLLNKYLSKNGFEELFLSNLKYDEKGLSEKERLEKRAKNVNKAMRETSNLIFNVFKYQLVKYLGIFNLMYKFQRSQKLNVALDEIPGIDKLLAKLEYNAFSPKARLASDYGVTNNVIDYYDLPKEQRKDIRFDDYEKELLKKVKKIIGDL